MKDYTLIESTWGNKLLRHDTAYISLAKLNISEENKHLLEHVGLPVMLDNGSENLLPFTYFPSIVIQDKEFYLLGDMGIPFIGVNFLGLDKESEKVYDICLRNENKSTYSFMNQSLYQYLMCLAYYTNFITTDYPVVSSESKVQVRADYQQLKSNMTSIDPKAMTESNSFWTPVIFGIQVNGWGDYFSDIDYDNFEPLTPEEQKKMDETGFPF